MVAAMNQEKLKIMEQTTAPRIIVFLKEKGKASTMEIMDQKNIQGNQTTKYSALRLLKENELITQSLPQGQFRRVDYGLTEKGKKVAECLSDLSRLL